MAWYIVQPCWKHHQDYLVRYVQFRGIVHLDLGGCELGRNITPQIGNISTLKYLDLSTCNLSGDLPPSLGNLTRLEFLHISYNGIQGPIPSTLGQLTNLQSQPNQWIHPIRNWIFIKFV
ncbi:hypothetical protein GQ457_13G025160 [Hibiscus cannabinus]